MTTPVPAYDWVREINPNLKKLDSIPLTGNSPPFPWEDFSARLSRSFECEGIAVKPGEMTWRSKENLYEGFGDTSFPLTFSLPSLRGQVTWIMPSQDISLLAAMLLTKDSHPITLSDQALIESFYHFLALEVLFNFTEVSFDKTLTPILTRQTTLPNQDSLCWDIALQLQNHTIWGRLIISPEFRLSWVEHFAHTQETSPQAQKMAQLAEVKVHLEAGKIQLSLAEWMSVRLGDFLMLENCSLEAPQFNGRIMLSINGKQAFRAKIKEGTLKILEHPLFHEVETSMAKQSDDEDDLSDLELPDEDDDLFSDTDLFTEESKTEDETSAIESGTESEADSHVETEEHSEDAKGAIPSKKEAPLEGKSSPIAPENIPITLIVEVGQIQMTMEQLLNLAPGNLLEINMQPENGVDLTIHGKVVGRGELIRIGEAIGVRVLQLGRNS